MEAFLNVLTFYYLTFIVQQLEFTFMADLNFIAHQKFLRCYYRYRQGASIWNHRITECFGLEGTFRHHLVQPSLPWAGSSSTISGFSKPCPTWFERFQWCSITSPGNLLQCLTTLIINNIFLYVQSKSTCITPPCHRKYAVDAVLWEAIWVLSSGTNKENSSWTTCVCIYSHAILIANRKSRQIGCYNPGSGNVCQVERTWTMSPNKVTKVKLLLRQLALQWAASSCNW